MFTDSRHMISLEYIFYQKDGYYRTIEPEIAQPMGKAHPLGCESYEWKQRSDYIKAFRQKPINYEINKDDYLKEN